MRYLLLVWRGKWTNDGPNDGRDCIFDSDEKAYEWIKQRYQGCEFSRHIIVPMEVPSAPW